MLRSIYLLYARCSHFVYLSMFPSLWFPSRSSPRIYSWRNKSIFHIRKMIHCFPLKSKKRCMVSLLPFLLLIYVTRIHYLIPRNLISVDPLLTNWDPYFINWTLTENISCHYNVTEEDALPYSAEDLTPEEDSIFFHETSCRGGLNSRQACSVESVARIHKERTIYVYFNSPVSALVLERSSLAKLTQFKNVKLARLHTNKYAKGTPLEKMLEKKENELSEWRIELTSDMLRYITMYKYGGVYLDTDVMVVKPLDALGKNWAAREDNVHPNVAALAFTKHGVGHQLLSIILQDIRSHYQPQLWGDTGLGALHRALVKLCSATYVLIANTTDFICAGVKVYNPSLLYPIHWAHAEVYFEFGDLPEDTEQAFTHHLWNKMTRDLPVKAGSPYDKLSRRFCPTVREMYGDRFGW